MFFSARQLEQLLRESGGAGVTLPYRARLTPAAMDWAKLKKVAIGYSDDSFRGQPAKSTDAGSKSPTGFAAGKGAVEGTGIVESTPAGTLLWWCDGPCGAAKAAITAQERESPVRPVIVPADGKLTASVVKAIASEIKAGSATAAVLLVQTAAMATLLANRNPVLRAAVGTSLDAVEQGIKQIAANVLVIEVQNKPFPLLRSMLSRFAKAKRELSVELKKELQIAGG